MWCLKALPLRYAIIGLLVLLVISFYIDNKGIRNKNAILERNNIAYSSQIDNLNKANRQFELTISHIESSRDSMVLALDSMRKSLKIKDKNLKSLGYVKSEIHKVDTIVVKDSIFASNLDTLLSDKWYSLKLDIRQPDTIICTPKFESKLHIITSYKTEYPNGRSKIFFIRWFQRKRKVVTINVVEENPYINVTAYKFIEVIK